MRVEFTTGRATEKKTPNKKKKIRLRRVVRAERGDVRIVLTMDAAPCHLALKREARDHFWRVLVIPRGCTPLLQPCDLALFRSLKASMRKRFQEVVTSQGNSSTTKAELVEVTRRAWETMDFERLAEIFGRVGLTLGPPVYREELQSLLGEEEIEPRRCSSDEEQSLFEESRSDWSEASWGDHCEEPRHDGEGSGSDEEGSGSDKETTRGASGSDEEGMSSGDFPSSQCSRV